MSSNHSFKRIKNNTYKSDIMKKSSYITTIFVGIVALFVVFSFTKKKENKEIGLQLYSLRADIKTQGIEKVLSEVAQMGYTQLELAGYKKGLVYGMAPLQFKKMTDKHGLEITSSHVVKKMSNDPEADEAFWSMAIKTHAEMGVKYIIMPILPLKNSYPFKADNPITMKDVEATCEYFTKIGEMANEAGLKFGFHNHAHEHKIKVEGKPIFDLMLEKLDPKYVVFQMDVYWVKEGGYDPVDYLKKYAGRFPLLHIKDEHGVGASGVTDFGPIFKAAYKQGMEAYYVEVEEYIGTPIEDVKQSYDFLNNAKYVR
jgi:sugar phosphate isomerase/epimerase